MYILVAARFAGYVSDGRPRCCECSKYVLLFIRLADTYFNLFLLVIIICTLWRQFGLEWT